MITNEHNRGDWADNGNSPAPLVAATFVVAAILAALALVACSSDPEVVTVLVERDREVRVVETVIVDRELRVEVPVLETVIVERDVPRTVVVERDRETPVTVVVDRDREVQVTVVVEQTRIVERERIVRQTVVVEATPEPTAATFYGVPIPKAEPTMSEPPRPRTGADTVVIRTGAYISGSGDPAQVAPDYGTSSYPEPGDPTLGMFTRSSVTEKFFLTDEVGNAVNQIIEGWRLVQDRRALGGQALIFDLKENVPFHDQWGDFGDLTADDVVWAYNRGSSGGGAAWSAIVGDQPLTRVDRHTVRVPLRLFNARWDTDLFGQSGVRLSISSKRAFDEMGEDWVRDHVVGTGPYRIEEYSRDAALKLKAVQNHHRITPSVEHIVYEPIRDDSVAVSALRAGRVDVAVVRPKNYPSLTADGFEFVGSGAGTFHSIAFAGNYWQDSIYTHDPHDFEEPIAVRPFEIPIAHPWIGYPDDPRAGFPPEGMTSMERASMVRRALSLAIDRDRIVEVLFPGAARVNFVYVHDINNPNHKSRWNVPYDPDLAEELLDRAGHRGGDFPRFEMPLFVDTRYGDNEVGTAVAGMWREIGIDVQEWKSSSVFYDPILVGHTSTVPQVFSGNFPAPHEPWDWPFVGSGVCSGGRSSHPIFMSNIGIEVQELCEWGTSMLEEQNKSRRIAIRDEIADFLSEWNLVIGVAVTANVAVVNPKKIASWDMPLSVRGDAIHHPEFLVTVQ